MTKGLVITVVAGVLAVGVHGSVAGPIQKREKRQEHRIERGVKSGKVTPKEKQRLENQQEVIEKEREQAMEDGKITPQERGDIRHDQNRLSRDIYRKKHNARHD